MCVEDETLKKSLGHKIAVARGSNISQHKLAEKIGTDHKAIWRYENGKQCPSAIRLFQIANALNIDVRSLNPYDSGF